MINNLMLMYSRRENIYNAFQSTRGVSLHIVAQP